MQARIIALEYLVKHLVTESVALNAAAREGTATAMVDDLKQYRKDIAEEMRGATLPLLDPAMSDHLTDLVARHLDRLIDEMIEEL